MSDDEEPTPRLPRLAVAMAFSLDGDYPVPVLKRRHASVLVLLGAVIEARDVAYLRALAVAHGALKGWDGQVFAIVPKPGRDPIFDEVPLPFAVVYDGWNAFGHAGVAPPALIIADQWGDVHYAATVTDEAPWLPVEKVEQWLRFLATRCAG